MTTPDDIKKVQPRTNVYAHLPGREVYAGPLETPVETFLEAAYPDADVPFIAALVDGQLRELTYPLRSDSHITPIDLSDSDGVRIYRRSLAFVFVAAWHTLFPDIECFIDHSLPFGGYFCETQDHPPLTPSQIEALQEEMQRLVDADLTIDRQRVPIGTALDIFRKRGEQDKVALFQSRAENHGKNYLRMYQLNGYQDYFHGYMVPSTGYLKYFRLMPWGDGLILQFPRRVEPTRLQEPRRSSTLLNVFREYGRWLRLLGVSNVSDLNAKLESDSLLRLILVSEALHEQRIADIARRIWSHDGKIRLVLIAGPSSSGKTTFSKRLAVQLLARGLRPFSLELDNYFVNREDTPLDEQGEYNFEALEAVDLDLFNNQLEALLGGECVRLPRFDFRTGKRRQGEEVQLEPDHIIIVEGIHGLNPRLVTSIPAERTFKIFVSALTQLNLDRHNRVPTTDTRLIRRIVRDARTRGYTAPQTIDRWESVRRGEKRYIFPHQKRADMMFNSALAYELAVLKPLAEPLLLQVKPHSPERVEAKRLLAFLEWFQPAEMDLVPENSILREFVGGLSLEGFRWD